jgi:mono/diheme cytochrome c family protein
MNTTIYILRSILASVVFATFFAACESEQPGEEIEYRTDMYYQPSFKPQEDPLARVAGTVPMSGYEPAIKDSMAATRLKNPFAFTRASEDTGKFLFNTYCSVCHGAGAKGDGLVAPKFQVPPDLTGSLYKKTPDGYFYEHTTQRERWLIVAHLRRLQQQ